MTTTSARPGERFAAVWRSPVWMTWGSLVVRVGGVVLVWPLALGVFSATEIILWQIFTSLLALVVVMDFGLGPVLMRLAAARAEGFPGETTAGEDTPSARFARLARVARRFYRRLGLAAIILLVPVGLVIAIRIGQLDTHEKTGAWIAWLAVALAFLIHLRAGGASALLQGAGQLARVRRTEMWSGTAGVVMTMLGLWWAESLAVVAFVMLGVACAQALCWFRWLKIELGGTHDGPGDDIGPLMRYVWKGTWRSGVGLLCSAGVAQAAALVVAAFAGTVEAAAYLVAWRFLSIAGQLAQAPFYARLPEFGGLATEGRTGDLLKRSGAAMASCLGIFTAGVLLAGGFAPGALRWVGAEVIFPDKVIWSLMAVALFWERYGAMHLQLDTLGHDVKWHIAAGGYAIVTISVMTGTLWMLGVLAVPLGMALGQILFFCPYARRLSQKRYGWTWGGFDWPATVWFCVLMAGLFLFL